MGGELPRRIRTLDVVTTMLYTNRRSLYFTLLYFIQGYWKQHYLIERMSVSVSLLLIYVPGLCHF